jgi:amidohydrolase
MIEKLINIRKTLHQNPELANQEVITAAYISKHMESLNPDQVLSVAKTGKVFLFEGQKPGPTVVFRADMDALPIKENNDDLEYKSQQNGVAHLCGHDGHMTIILGLAMQVAKNRPVHGKVAFLFQPAEESEQGARDVVNDANFKKLQAEYVFGLHNIPGEKKHSIILKENAFAAASKGLSIKFFGQTSHAAEPENGHSPQKALARISLELEKLNHHKHIFSTTTFLTIIHMVLGEIAFGTNPGYAELRATLRSFDNKDMDTLMKKTEQIIAGICHEEEIRYEFEYSEEFPVTYNHRVCYKLIKESAINLNLNLLNRNEPFRWSEDFGYYSEKYETGFFGLGAGKNQPALHNDHYDFPDDIIQTGIEIFYSIYQILNLK